MLTAADVFSHSENKWQEIKWNENEMKRYIGIKSLLMYDQYIKKQATCDISDHVFLLLLCVCFVYLELVEYFRTQMSQDPDVASAVAAIRSLLEFLKRDQSK